MASADNNPPTGLLSPLNPTTHQHLLSIPPQPGRAPNGIQFSELDTRPIVVNFPLSSEDLQSQPTAHKAKTLTTRTKEFLLAGILTPDTPHGLPRDIWIRVATELVAYVHNSLQTSLLASQDPFYALSPEETHFLEILRKASSSLSHFLQSPFQSPEDRLQCLRCLYEGTPLTSPPCFESVMLSCDQNVAAAYTTFTNDLIRDMHASLTAWASDTQSRIQDAMSQALTNSSFDITLLDHDPEVTSWITNQCNTIRDSLLRDAESKARSAAESLYQEELARASAELDTELLKFKHDLRIETELRKDNARKAADAAVKAVSRNHPCAPPLSTSASSRVTRSQTRSMRPTPNPSRPNLPMRPQSTTPKASPSISLMPGHVLTEPLTDVIRGLSEPLTDISVGPPENSLESLMLKVDTEPLPPPIEPSSSTLPSKHPKATMLGCGLDQASPPSPFPIPADAPTAQQGIMALLSQISSQMSTQFSSIESKLTAMDSRIDSIERPDRYTPSAPAKPWQMTPFDYEHAPPNDTSLEPFVFDDARSVYSDHSMSDGAPMADDLEDRLIDHYKTYYDIKGNMNKAHNHIFRYEYTSSFTEWVEDNKGVADPAVVAASLSTDEVAAFHGWRMDTLQFKAKHAPNAADWQHKIDAISRALSLPDAGPVLRDPAPTGKESRLADPESDGEVPPEVHPVINPRNNAGPRVNTQRPSSPDRWVVVGSSGKAKSFAAVAANPSARPRPMTTNTTPPVLPPKESDPFTKAQLQGMTNAQICASIKRLFHFEVRNKGANKASLIHLFLSKQSQANPIDLVTPTPSPPPPPPPTTSNTAPTATSCPRARPANQAAKLNSEFTVLAHPAEVSTRAKKLPPDEIVCNLRTAMNQAHGGQRPLVTLLSGRWSSSLSYNFVLTFAGHPENDQVYKYRSILTSPFGLGACLIPQMGYTKVVIHHVPVHRDDKGNVADSKTLLDELLRNPSFFDLSIVVRPQWFLNRIPLEKRHSSITISFIDTDGSKLQTMLANPPSVFGGLTYVEKYVPLPIICGCDRCHALDHSVGYCNVKKGTTICPLCAGSHHAKDHYIKCASAPHNRSLTCTCPPKCINCHRVKKSGNGHTALSPSCPLQKLYRSHANRTGDSSDEERPVIARIVESPAPSSQPMADGQKPHDAITPDPAPPRDPFSGAAESFCSMKGITQAQLMSDPSHFTDYVEFMKSYSHPVQPAPTVA